MIFKIYNESWGFVHNNHISSLFSKDKGGFKSRLFGVFSPVFSYVYFNDFQASMLFRDQITINLNFKMEQN